MSEDDLQQSEFSGEIISPLQVTDDKYEFTFQDKHLKSSILVKVFVSHENDMMKQQIINELKYGAVCQLQGTLKVPRSATNPGQFDYDDYLSKKKINYELIIDSQNQFDCHGSKFLHHIYQFRQVITQMISEKLSPETAQWLNALVLGNRTLIDQETITIFQRWGLSHILAISGLHTGIIVGIVYFLLVKLLITTKEKAHFILIVFLPIFALVTGGEPSVWRASLMVLLLLLFNKLKINLPLLDILSIVFIALLLIDKNLIFHIGFQFSFLVTFGILLSSQLIKQSKSRLYQGLLISFVAQMIILPIQLHYFSIFQPLSILLNIIVIPYFSLFVIPFMLFFLLIMLFPNPIVHVFDSLFILINDMFLLGLKFVDKNLDYALLMGDIPFFYFVFYYLFFFLLMSYLQRNKLSHSFISGVFLVGLLCSLALRPYFSPVGTVTMLDIGQGDALVVELPYRKGVFLIDAGSTVTFPDFKPTDYVYDSIIQPYLNKRSIYHVDAVFLSHEHLDHYGSMPYLIKDKHVEAVIVSPYFKWEDQLDDMLEKYNIPIYTVLANEKISLNGHDFYILSPNKNFNSANDNSLVIYTQFGSQSWLFTGDIEIEAERHLANSVNQLHVDVLKVAHHGSNTSTHHDLLRQLQIDYALIPVGNNNVYGHPATDVLERLKEENIHIFRTDEDGAIQYFYNDHQFVFKRYNEKDREK